ncbi:unnamed protein product [Diatraea saccharalis]|uniref:Uncharacterized protein n=1 Tax=Diatraea saccharalis TaxID=40085 RepID=A0A9N9MZ64_9NEOP|nr:unnamed protein product [Diatraea saccharalis]
MALKQESAPTLTPSRLPTAYKENSIPPLATEDFDEVLAFEDSEIAIRKFFNNDLAGAMDIMTPCGVRLGTATFNLMISLLPPKIISVLEFVGFSGNKIYPNSVWFLVFKGRLELLRGQFEPAIETYNRVVVNQQTWKQFRHVCYWEIMWVNGLMMEWRDAALYAGKLIEESSWSRTVYSYTKAAMLLQLGDKITAPERQHCNELLRLKNDIKEDTFLLPYSVAEMAMCHYHLGNKDRAIQMLHDARKKYSGYSLESRLHFRLHSKMQTVKGGN